MWVWTYDCSFIATRSGKTEAGRQDCIHIFSTRKDVFPKFTMQVFCSFLSIPMCGKSRKHSFKQEVIADSSVSRAWTSSWTPSFWVTGTTHFEIVDIICQIWPIRGYTRSWYTGKSRLKKWLQAPPPFLSPVSSRFFSCSRFLNSADPNISHFAYS